MVRILLFLFFTVGIARAASADEQSEFCAGYKAAYEHARTELLNREQKSAAFLGMSTIPNVAMLGRGKSSRIAEERRKVIVLLCPPLPRIPHDSNAYDEGIRVGMSAAADDLKGLF